MRSVTTAILHNRTDEVIDRVRRRPTEPITIKKRGRPDILLVDAGYFEDLIETLEILSDPKTKSKIRQGLADIAAGRVISHEEVGRRLGLHGNDSKRRRVVRSRNAITSGRGKSLAAAEDLRKGKRSGPGGASGARRKAAA